MRDIDDPAWSDNPSLNAWLTDGRAAFADLTAAGRAGEGPGEGPGGPWDFSPASLDRLEGLIRSRYASWDALYDDGMSPFVHAVSWYLGEVCVRRHGAVWKRDPAGPRPQDAWRGCPALTVAYQELTDDEQDAVAAAEEEDEDPLPTVTPLHVVDSLYASDTHHLDLVLEPFADFERWRAERGGGPVR